MGILTEDWSTETLGAPLWFLQPWGIKDNCRDNGSHQKPSKLSAPGQKEILSIPSEVSLPTWSQVKAPYTKEEVTLWKAQSPMSPENLFMVILAALTCTSAMSVSEHMYWSYVLHSPLFQLVDWMSSTPLILIMTPVFMVRPWDYHLRKRTMFIFSLGFVSFLIYIGWHNICVLIKWRTRAYFYKVPELLIMWVSFQTIL